MGHCAAGQEGTSTTGQLRDCCPPARGGTDSEHAIHGQNPPRAFGAALCAFRRAARIRHSAARVPLRARIPPRAYRRFRQADAASSVSQPIPRRPHRSRSIAGPGPPRPGRSGSRPRRQSVRRRRWQGGLPVPDTGSKPMGPGAGPDPASSGPVHCAVALAGWPAERIRRSRRLGGRASIPGHPAAVRVALRRSDGIWRDERRLRVRRVDIRSARVRRVDIRSACARGSGGRGVATRRARALRAARGKAAECQSDNETARVKVVDNDIIARVRVEGGRGGAAGVECGWGVLRCRS